jgi:hypothetical protein
MAEAFTVKAVNDVTNGWRAPKVKPLASTEQRCGAANQPVRKLYLRMKFANYVVPLYV